MDDIAVLGLEVRSDSVVWGKERLDRLTVASEKAERAALGLGSRTQQAGEQMASGFDRAEAAARRLMGTLAAVFSANWIKNAVDQWSDLTSRVRNAIGPLGDVSRTLGRLSEMADRSYSSIGLTAEVWLQSTSVLKALGVETGKQLDMVESLNNAMVISATRGQRAQSVTEAWTKALALGTLQGDNLNAVLMYSDRLALALADSMGVSVLELRKLGTEGKITRSEMLGLTSQIEKLRAEAEAMPATIADGFLRIGNALLRQIGVFDQANGLSQDVAAGMVAIADNLGTIIKLAAVAGTALLAAFGVRLVGTISASVAQMVALEMALGASSVRAALFSSGIKSMTAAWRTMTAAMVANPFGLMAVAIATTVAAMTIFRDDIRPVADEVATLGDYERAAWEDIDATISDVGDAIVDVGSATVSAVEWMMGGIGLQFDFAEMRAEQLLAILRMIPGVGPVASSLFGIAGDAAGSLREDANEIASRRQVEEHLNEVFADFGEMASKNAAATESLTKEQEKLHKAAQNLLLTTKAETEGLLRVAEAHGISARAVIEATVANEAHSAKLKNRMVDERALREELLKRVAAEQASAAAQQLAANQEATLIARARARASQIADPAARHAAEISIERQEYLNELQQKYSLQLERIPELMAEWDQEKAYSEQQRFWNDVRELASDISGDITDFLVDGFVNAGEGGKSMFKNLWDGALAGAKRFVANLAAEFLKQKLILPIVTAFVGENSSLMGIISPGGTTGSIAGVGNSASLFGGLGDLAGSAWSGVSGLFGGGATAASSAASSAASLAAWTGGANSMAASGTGALGGIQAAAAAIPVWGWIMAAASTVKGFVEGSDPASLKGGISTLIGPSLEEWQATPRRAAANAMDPFGTMLTDFGLPEFLTIGGIAGKIFGLDKAPSNKFAQTDINTAAGTISDPMFNPSEYSQGTVDASQQTAQAYLDITKLIAEITGGTGPAAAYIHAGERVPYQVNVGDEGLGFFSAGRQTFQDAESALNWMVQEFAKGLTGVTDENFRKAIAHGGTGEEILANLQFVANLNTLLDDGSMALVNALKTVNEQFDSLTEQASELGIATADLESLREKEIAATRKQFEAGITQLESEINSTATQYFAQTLDPLTQFRDSVLRQGELSNMSSRDQYLYSQSLFRGIDDTTSASDAVSIAQSYLQQARAYGASGNTFTDAFREVNSVISDLISQREDEKKGFEALGVIFNTSVADQTRTLGSKMDEMIEELRLARRAKDLAQ